MDLVYGLVASTASYESDKRWGLTQERSRTERNGMPESVTNIEGSMAPFALRVQARSQWGFEGVRTNPPCILAKFIFNETAAVQGTIIQPCSGPKIERLWMVSGESGALCEAVPIELYCLHCNG